MLKFLHFHFGIFLHFDTSIYKTYRIITGSSNLTKTALTSNIEWNTRIISTEQGEIAGDILGEFDRLWNSEYSIGFDDFFEVYKERYNIIKKQREVAASEKIVSLQKYTLKPNSMQEQFIVNLKKMLAKGEDRVLLISSTNNGTPCQDTKLNFYHEPFFANYV